MIKYNNIAVWDLTFVRTDDEGNPLEDKEGKVITYDVKNYDCSYLAEGLDVKDLKTREI
tara:strand:+ start:358 stop:534 length:177 start_codon:yes stop_codon:yes gene_type:complete